MHEDLVNSHLHPAQVEALSHVREAADEKSQEARDRIDTVLETAGVDVDSADIVAAIRSSGEITLNFHPDRLLADRRAVVQALLDEGIYRNQFESRISNGGLTAFPGGDRDNWEHRLFGGAYHGRAVDDAHRPRYGGLNLMKHLDGACPRFGSCHFRLKPYALDWATFSFGDSATHPEDVGVINSFAAVLAAVLEDAQDNGRTLGGGGMNVNQLVSYILSGQKTSPRLRGRSLDHYIEAQVHATIRLRSDIAELVADPSFRGTEVGEKLVTLARQHDFVIKWHDGFKLLAVDIPPEFRGPDVPVFADRVTREFSDSRHLDAASIGRAAASVAENPDRWDDWASPEETLQHIKYIWHSLVQLGQPFVTHDQACGNA